MAEAIRDMEEAIRRHGLMSDQELARVERGPSDQDVSRLLKEYRLCRALLREALGHRARILQLSEGGEERGGQEAERAG